MMNKKGLYAILVVAAAALVFGFFTINKAHKSTQITGSVSAGEKLYANYCASCHGDHGEGKRGLGRALSDPHYLQGVSNEQIWSDIAYGRDKTAMGPSLKGLKGVKQLTEEQINDLVVYIRSFQNEVRSSSNPK